MRVAVASNHIGFKVKGDILAHLKELGHDAIDLGPLNSDVCDYPDYAARAARAVSSGQVDRAILVGGTGIGMSITANKFRGIRAALCHDVLTAQLSRRQVDANILCLSANIFDQATALQLITIWLGAEFEGGHHSRRLAKISELENALSQKVECDRN